MIASWSLSFLVVSCATSERLDFSFDSVLNMAPEMSSDEQMIKIMCEQHAELRKKDPVYEYLRHRLREVDPNAETVIVEVYPPDCLLIYFSKLNGQVQVATNAELEKLGGEWKLAGPSRDILEYKLDLTKDGERYFEDIDRLKIKTGIGGAADVDDGPTFMFTYLNGEKITQFMLYGAEFDVQSDMPMPRLEAKDDRSRYVAIEKTFAFVISLLLSPKPKPEKVIPVW